MNYFDLKPTEENLANCLANDCLNRQIELVNFIKCLDFPNQGFAVAINGGWGSGKTFFVKQAISILNYSNSILNLERSEHAESIMKSWSRSIKDEKEELPKVPHFAAYYDAWEHDDSEDPILSVLFQLTKATGIRFENNPNLKKIGLSIADIITEKSISNFIKLVDGESILDNEEKNSEVRTLIKEYLNELVVEKAQRFDLFIDELDRCKPTYAVKLLERIKHYFDCDNLTIVFSINERELKKTIAKYYGEGIDGISYLDKFFDMRMTLTKPQDLEDFFRLHGMDTRSLGSLTHDRVCYLTAIYLNMELREIVHYIKIVRLVDSKFIHSGDDYSGLKMLHMLFAPILIGLKMKSPEKYEKCINGEDASCILNILSDFNERYYCNLMKEDNEAFEWDGSTDNKTIITREDKITQLYELIFPVHSAQEWMQIGNIVIYRQHVEELIKSCNLMAGSLSFDSL